MNISRVWEMPNSKTFEINALYELIKKYVFPTAIARSVVYPKRKGWFTKYRLYH